MGPCPCLALGSRWHFARKSSASDVHHIASSHFYTTLLTSVERSTPGGAFPSMHNIEFTKHIYSAPCVEVAKLLRNDKMKLAIPMAW